jgi:coenzyme Q-binding protein COQ10
MPTYTETRILPFTPEQLFVLVIDIEKYPKFLPWCRGARIVSRESDGSFIGELIIRFMNLTERYTSKVVASPLTSHHAPRTIDVTLVSGPFHHLENHWRFVPHPQGCELHFDVDFAFKSKLLDTMIGGVFTRATEKMVAAFTARAESMYRQP